MSFSETCVRPRLLFGRFLQAYCKREKNYHKSTIDLNDCLKNSNGAFNSAKGKYPAFDFPLNYDSNAHLEGNNIVAELPSKQQKRHHAIYDLDVCLCNENGELKWHVHDGLFDRDGAITRAIEAIPIVGFFMALIHKQNGNPDHAKRALTLSGKGTFAILFGVIALQIAPFDPSAALVVAVMSFLGTIIADLTIETTGRSWIKNKRIATDIPDRSWTNTLLDGLVAGIAVGAGAGIAPHAEDAAARVVRTVATVPEEMALAEIELLSMESMVYNVPKLVKEIAKAATGGVVRATPGGFQMLATQDLKSGYASPFGLQSSHVTPGRYYIANAQTGDFLELGLSGDGNGSQIQGAKASFKDNQVWIIEQGSEGQTFRSLDSDAYIRYPIAGTGLSVAQPIERDSAIEFRFEGNNKDGFSLCTLDKQSTGTVLSLNHDGGLEVDNKNVRFSDDVGALNQKWLLEECTASDVLELYQGPIPTNQVLHVRDVASNAPLELESAWKRGGLDRIFGRKTHGWTLESGFNGYYLKHCASGLYAFAAPNLQDNDMLPLTLGPAETEFILDGNSQDGYSFINASDPTYGLEIDRDIPVSGSNVFVLWRLNGSHSRWRIENQTSS